MPFRVVADGEMTDDNSLLERMGGTRRAFLAAVGAAAVGVGSAAGDTDGEGDVSLAQIDLGQQMRRDEYVTASASTFDPSELQENELAFVDDGQFGVYDGSQLQTPPLGTANQPVPEVHSETLDTEELPPIADKIVRSESEALDAAANAGHRRPADPAGHPTGGPGRPGGGPAGRRAAGPPAPR